MNDWSTSARASASVCTGRERRSRRRPAQGDCGWCYGWAGDTRGSTVPEASKLPVIFPMMQRSVHNHRESILLRRSQSAGPAHRLTGCHNNPDPAPRLLEQNSGKPTATATPLVTTPSRRSLWTPGKHSVLGVNIVTTKGGRIWLKCVFTASCRNLSQLS